MIDTIKVRARMLMLGLTQPDVADAIGINVATFNQKLNNKRRIYMDEYLKLCEILKLHTAEEREELLGVALI